MASCEGVKMSKLQCKLSQDDSLIICDDLGKYSEYEEQLWSLFLRTYEYNSLKFHDIPVRMKHYPPSFSPKTGFYHLTCENYLHQEEDSRKPNLRRCERLMWAKTIIESCSDSCASLLVWENTRHNKPNIVLFCPELDYVVILSKRSQGYYLLTTAYPVDHPHRMEDLLNEYQRYIKQTAHPVLKPNTLSNAPSTRGR